MVCLMDSRTSSLQVSCVCFVWLVFLLFLLARFLVFWCCFLVFCGFLLLLFDCLLMWSARFFCDNASLIYLLTFEGFELVEVLGGSFFLLRFSVFF